MDIDDIKSIAVIGAGAIGFKAVRTDMRRPRCIAAIIVLLCVACAMPLAALADELPRARPEDVGLNSQRLARIRAYFEARVANKELPGAVFLLSRRGKVVLFDAVGFANLETRAEMKTDHIFRIASMSKPITAIALMTLYEQGRFQMSDPLSKHLVEFEGIKVLADTRGDGTRLLVKTNRPPTMRDLLRHTAGFSYGFNGEYGPEQLGNPYNSTLAEFVSRIAGFPLQYQPGEKWVYSISNDLQGRMVEILSGMSLDDYLQNHLFKPLKMADTGFMIPEGKRARFGPEYSIEQDGPKPIEKLGGINGRAGYRVDQWLGSVTMYSGGGGLASTAADYWRLAQMMLNKGVLDGTRVLAPRTVEIMTTDQLEGIADRKGTPPGYGYGFGVVTTASDILPRGSYYWGGSFGTRFWIDPENEIIGLFMSQTYPDQIAPELEKLKALVYSAVVE